MEKTPNHLPQTPQTPQVQQVPQTPYDLSRLEGFAAWDKYKMPLTNVLLNFNSNGYAVITRDNTLYVFASGRILRKQLVLPKAGRSSWDALPYLNDGEPTNIHDFTGMLETNKLKAAELTQRKLTAEDLDSLEILDIKRRSLERQLSILLEPLTELGVETKGAKVLMFNDLPLAGTPEYRLQLFEAMWFGSNIRIKTTTPKNLEAAVTDQFVYEFY
ncbi:MAG: hypothetical protein HY438_02985 [DPANN group archaeon]|nr:hypothetical protein [DPANN group archaeon]